MGAKIATPVCGLVRNDAVRGDIPRKDGYIRPLRGENEECLTVGEMFCIIKKRIAGGDCDAIKS